MILLSSLDLQLIHGLMDRIMEVTGTPFVQPGDNTGYYIKRSEVSGSCAAV